MRITICCKRFGPSGGAEAFLGSFARCLVADGHRVRVLAAEFTGAVEGVETVPLRVAPAPRMLQDLALARASAKVLAAETDADVTFSDQKCWGADVVRPGGGVQREWFPQWVRSHPARAGRALSALRHALSIRDRLRLHVDDRLYAPPGPRLVIANSDMVRRNLLKHYLHVADRVRVVYNGADPGRFHPGLRDEHRERMRAELGIPADALACVFVGTGWRRKGLFPTIRALGLLGQERARRQVCCIVVGRGNRPMAERYARRHGAEGALRFVGQVDPRPCYGAADVLVLPSFFDPCANVTFEGLACGLPIITSAYNGAYEQLTPGVNGFFVEDPADAEGLARLIGHYLDEEKLNQSRTAARALALEHTLERQYREIMEAIGSITRGR